MKIWYLYHSGFAVKTNSHLLAFDCWKTGPRGGRLQDGVINPAEIGGENVIVFASHAHGDHFTPEIFDWKQGVAQIRYVLSDDIRREPGALRIGPGETLTQPDFTVKALRSTDEGVAFLVKIDDKCIYHAGDLNWWHWAGETRQYNADMEKNYKEQIALLQGERIDLAFVPVDPRLEDQYSWGIDYFMRETDTKKVVPMHFSWSAGTVERLLADPVSLEYRDRILPLTERGQSAEI